MKKRIFTLLLILLFAAFAALGLAACNRDNVIVVGASAEPHAQILNVIKDKLAEKGYTLEVKVFGDYVTPNLALNDGELDANYFQHTPYLNTFNRDYGTNIAAVGKIHYEPFGLFGKDVSAADYAVNKTGRRILIPNDGSNLTRALFLLKAEGFVTLDESASPLDTLTVQDIRDSKGNAVVAVEADTVAAQLAESPRGTLAIINGNYALQAGLDVKDALAVEDASSEAAQLYANVLAVRAGDEDSPKAKALLEALLSKEVYDFITSTYSGSVLPVFSL